VRSLGILTTTLLAPQALAAGAVGPATALPHELRNAVLIDSIVARINRHPITQSQLEAEARVAMAQHGHVAEAQAPLSQGELQTALDYLIDQMLLEEEAERLQIFPVTDEETRAGQEGLIAQFPSVLAYQEFLERFGIGTETVEESVRRGLRAERYLTDRIRTQIQAGASQEEANAVAKELVAQLRARSDVRVLVQLQAGDHAQTTPGDPSTRADPGRGPLEGAGSRRASELEAR
jgi:hypothetical protein